MSYSKYPGLLATLILSALIIFVAATVPGVSADGGDDIPPPPPKRPLPYPNLGSHLSGLAEAYEDGSASQSESAGQAAMSLGGSVAVTIHLIANVSDVVQFLQDNGGDPRNVGEDYIEAYVPVSLLGALSEQPGVIRVREIVPPQPAQLTQQVIGNGPSVHVSQPWNDAGYSGQGIKVGIIDDFRSFPALRGIEVPRTVVARCYTEVGRYSSNLADCEQVPTVSPEWGRWPECVGPVTRRASIGSQHGTWVAESLLDIAPGASLYIANPGSRADLQATVDWMVSQGVTVINYSVGWFFDGPGDGNSPLSVSPLNTVDRAVEGGTLWVNSAGNNADGTWFGSYSDPDGDSLISVGDAARQEVNGLPLSACRTYRVQLRWEDRWRGANTDLNLYLYDRVAREYHPTINSEDPQSGESGHDPFEFINFRSRGESDRWGIVVAHHSGPAPEWIQITAWGPGGLEDPSYFGSITNPAESANQGMLAVGAAPWYDVQTIEYYSSAGPTPDDRTKPDIVGADCGATSLTPLDQYNEGFCGTSQAAPHVAGLAALVRQRFPDYTPAEAASYMKYHAQQRETPDPNNTWGYGFAQLPSPDREALVALYNATGGANWANNANWLTNAPISQWHGVTTDASGLVTSLGLNDNQLSGTMPTQLGSLSNLQELNLTRNQLTGTIPAELGRLTNLTILALGGNQLTGTIPTWLGGLTTLEEVYLWGNPLTGQIPSQLASLTNLRELHLSSNQLTGTIPTWLGSLTNLRGLDLGDNQLTGEIPTELGSLANLQELSLWGNQLTGEIPTELGSLANLQELWLGGNQLTGEIPTELGSLTNLTILALGGNQLTGTIPTWLGGLTTLEEVYLWGNPLTGQIPSQLASLTNLRELHLSSNQLTGTIPTWLGSLTNLRGLDLGDNQLTGEIPTELGSLANLQELSLWGNQLTGEIPTELGGLANLQELSLWGNQLTGEIPTELGGLANLQRLSLWGNQLTGDIPTELGSLTNLEQLRLSQNQLTGPIPTELGNLANLQVLWLGGNQLTGPIPTELGSLANLQELSLWGNQLTGEIPTELGSLANLQVLSLSQNRLTGSIPTELGGLANLEQLRLGRNQLTGPIPAELGGLANLEQLRLGGNQLTGAIPSQLASLANLEQLRLHYNGLSGVVPQTLAGLTMLEHFSFYNNPGLCAPADDAFQTWLRGISTVYGSSCAQADSPEDRAVLVEVHSTTDGVNWTNNANWLSGDLTRQWYGVTNDANGRVNGLFLGDNQLTGEIPPELGDLTNLELLDLSGNQLTGEIPTELGRLTNLTLLRLSGNQLTGCVPASLQDIANNDFAQLGLSFCTVAPPVDVTATRSFSPVSVAPGGQLVVTIAVANYGSAGGVTETLPAGFTYVSSSLPDSQVTEVDARTVRFALQGETSYTYTVTASETVGTYSFSGTLRDFDRNDLAVAGASTVTVSSGDPLITRYDANNNGTIEKSEVIKAITDYLFGEGEPISKAEVIKLITLYLFG